MLPPWLRSPSDAPLHGVRGSAVAVIRTPHDTLHAGILYRDGSAVRVIHFAFDRELADVSPASGWHWVRISAVRDLEARQIAALCKVILARDRERGGEPNVPTGSIAYALRYNGGYFDLRGGLHLNGATGISCATFILAVYRAHRIELLDLADWPLIRDRPDDLEAARRYGDMLRRRGRAEQAQVVEEDTDARRYRVEEVVAACSAGRLRVSFAQASAAAALIAAVDLPQEVEPHLGTDPR